MEPALVTVGTARPQGRAVSPLPWDAWRAAAHAGRVALPEGWSRLTPENSTVAETTALGSPVVLGGGSRSSRFPSHECRPTPGGDDYLVLHHRAVVLRHGRHEYVLGPYYVALACSPEIILRHPPPHFTLTGVPGAPHENGRFHPHESGGVCCLGGDGGDWDWGPTMRLMAEECDWAGLLFTITAYLDQWTSGAYRAPSRIAPRAAEAASRCGWFGGECWEQAESTGLCREHGQMTCGRCGNTLAEGVALGQPVCAMRYELHWGQERSVYPRLPVCARCNMLIPPLLSGETVGQVLSAPPAEPPTEPGALRTGPYSYLDLSIRSDNNGTTAAQ